VAHRALVVTFRRLFAVVRRFMKMNAAAGAVVLTVAVGVTAPLAAEKPDAGAPPTTAELAGAWLGTATHGGDSVELALELEPAQDGQVLLKLTIPVTHVEHAAVGRGPIEIQGDSVKIGLFRFTYDRKAGTLSGAVPEELAPVYHIPMTLHRVARLDLPPRQGPTSTIAQPVWAFDAGAPLWAGATFAAGVVYAGGEDGRLHALDAKTGKERWSFLAGGAIRARATASGDDVYFQADDGYLYKVAAASGRQVWRVKVVESPIVRLPFDNPQSRYDRFGSDVTIHDSRLYLGTHDGKVLALDPTAGARVWAFDAGDSVLAAPTVDDGRVLFGSFDGNVYALDVAKGQLLWKHDTRRPVVSTPAVAGGLVLVGSRSYDFLALDARTGEPAWDRYVWFSWVESSATVRGGVAYVGSSDAAAVFAFDARSGKRVWSADVFGWAWGQPAVTENRVFIGTSSTRGYLAGHQGGIVALDRATGRPAWRYEIASPEKGPYGSPGSPATGAGLVFFTTLDGRVLAFAQ
jgi:outer membrane protein assembly factor BamB